MALEIAPGVWRTQLNQGLERAGKDSLWVKPFHKLRQRLKSHTTLLPVLSHGQLQDAALPQGLAPHAAEVSGTRHLFWECAHVPRMSGKAGLTLATSVHPEIPFQT